ncbi:hypothetical protein [Streptomyces anulatus]|uniref:hypothetical protein n=1 Tax=Streptomyces anulatus TaxID=1892 RepID=UPI0033DE73C6
MSITGSGSRTGPAAPIGDPRDREALTVLARLLSLYDVALRRGDEPVITAAEGDGDRELAEAVYQRIGRSLATLSPDDGPLVTITLDDRTPHTGDTSDA